MIEDSLEPKEMTLEIEKSLRLIEYREKRFTHFWLCSYQKGQHKIKVEVNKREFSNDSYTIKDFRGYSCRVLDKGSMFAHKLCAITERKVLQNRDLYDSWFMFSNDFPINEKIIEERLDKSVSEYCEDIIELIDTLPDRYNILNGLGSVLSKSKREWVKRDLLKELRKYLVSISV
jgi:hypothetical protein